MYRLYLLLSGCRYGHWLSHFPLCLIKIHIQTPGHPEPAAPDGKRNYGNVSVPFPQPTEKIKKTLPRLALSESYQGCL